MNTRLKKKLASLPTSPGIYFHKSKSGEILYVGKAAVLRNRVRQYFQNSRSFDNKTMALLAEIDDVDWLETDSEVDALFLESEMVKRYMPRYNILLRDDKSQMYVRIDMKSEWPTVKFTRNPIDDGADYYGPFYSGYALKKALRYLRPVFPYLLRERRPGQSRLDEDLGLSPKISDGSEAYKSNLRKLISYIKGNRKILTRELERDMKQAARHHDFETAAIFRNKLRHMQELQNRVMFGDREFLDISKDQALADLAELLNLPKEPSRIEGFDVSHISGQSAVASMVVFSNGVSDRAEYRKFKVDDKNDDISNMRQVIYRRLGERNIKAWGRPDLMLIDGGKGQLAAAVSARNERGLRLPIISIAKREEELIIHKTDSCIDVSFIEKIAKNPPDSVGVFIDGDYLVVNLHLGQIKSSSHSKNLRLGESPSRYDDIVKLFQRIRDESHRFAISYHQALQKKRQTKNALEEIPGIGPKTRAKLLRRFGSLAGIRQADTGEISELVGQVKAELIKQSLK